MCCTHSDSSKLKVAHARKRAHADYADTLLLVTETRSIFSTRLLCEKCNTSLPVLSRRLLTVSDAHDGLAGSFYPLRSKPVAVIADPVFAQFLHMVDGADHFVRTIDLKTTDSKFWNHQHAIKLLWVPAETPVNQQPLPQEFVLGTLTHERNLTQFSGRLQHP